MDFDINTADPSTFDFSKYKCVSHEVGEFKPIEEVNEKPDDPFGGLFLVIFFDGLSDRKCNDLQFLTCMLPAVPTTEHIHKLEDQLDNPAGIPGPNTD